MSFDIVDIVKSMDAGSVSLQLALQCAPVIAGMKISNLLTISAKKIGDLSEILEHTGLSFRIIYPGKKRLVILVYREGELRKYLNYAKVKAFISECGYEHTDINKIFPRFVRNYISYMENKKNFPHELGLLLGYPIEDVEGFIRNNGKNYLHSGYWKVYKDAETKIRLFKDYEKVQTEMVRLLYEGEDIAGIIDSYSNIGHYGEKKTVQMICA
ncbi:MAG: DUF3793 family protein [Catonella sp.]|uniref:DUF3793 family protein n=1 Tax=Catonella sp. TaxID=2382125 RepID=UPI003FA0AED3